MFLVDLTFVQPLEVVDRYVAAHRAHLAAHYASGTLLLGGRKNPRTGGVILSRHRTIEDVSAVFESDPLVVAGVATFSIIEFEPVMRAQELVNIV